MVLDGLIVPLAAGVTAVSAAAGILWAVRSRFYAPAPPNQALVLMGRGSPSRASRRLPAQTAVEVEVRRPRIVVGGGALVAPWSREFGRISLEPVVADVSVRSVQGFEGGRASGWLVRVQVEAKVPADPRYLLAASESLLDRSEEELRAVVRHAVERCVPAVLARLSPNAPDPDWERLAAEFHATVAPELRSWGLEVRTVGVAELLRIAPSSVVASQLRPETSRSSESSVGSGSRVTVYGALEGRLSRAEESLGVLGAELLRLTRLPERPSDEALGEVPGAPSLGLEGPGGTVRAAPPVLAPVHDPAGGVGTPSLRPVPSDGPGEEEGRLSRPLLD